MPSVVCFLDILGFQTLSRRAPKKAERFATQFQETLAEQMRDANPPMYKVEPLLTGISDAMFVTLHAQTPTTMPEVGDLRKLVTGLSWTLYNCLALKIPIRGSIGIGDVIQKRLMGISGDHLVGTAVTDAVVFEKEQEWIGISIVPRHGQMHDDILLKLKVEGFLTRWPVPTQSGLRNTWVVSWPKAELMNARNIIDAQYLSCVKKAGSEKLAADKYYSTRVFLDHLLDPNYQTQGVAVTNE